MDMLKRLFTENFKIFSLLYHTGSPDTGSTERYDPHGGVVCDFYRFSFLFWYKIHRANSSLIFVPKHKRKAAKRHNQFFRAGVILSSPHASFPPENLDRSIRIHIVDFPPCQFFSRGKTSFSPLNSTKLYIAKRGK